MNIRSLACADCGVKMEGEVPLPNLARLAPEEREFAESFIVCGGSLKELGRVLGISYPTVRGRLDRVISSLQALRRKDREKRLSVLGRLEKGEITAQEAARLLRERI